MGTYAILAEGLRYPTPGRLADLESLIANLPDGEVKVQFGKFISAIKALKFSEWEELHTRTLDLDPPAAPYIGFQTWGDSYQRGTFMSLLNRAITENNVETDGELPDHLMPVLRLKDTLAQPLDPLEEVLTAAVERIRGQLTKVDPANPYVHLLSAISAACASAGRTDGPSLSKN